MPTSFVVPPRPPAQRWHHPQWAGLSHVNHYLMEAFSQLRMQLLPPPPHSSWCQIDKNQTKPELTSTESLFPHCCTHPLPAPHMEGLLPQPLKSLPTLLPLPRTSITVPAVPGHMPLLLDTLSSQPQLRPVTSPSSLTSSSDEGNNNPESGPPLWRSESRSCWLCRQ